MIDCNIIPMTLEHFKEIESHIQTDFDSFWKPSIFEQELHNPNSKYFVAILNNEIVGIAGIWKAIDVMHITDIIVRKDLRRVGIGSKLLEKLIEESKNQGVTSLTLEVNAKNFSAQCLYQKYGFNILGTRKKYYNNIDDAIIMTLYF